jgi:hypothetical protein
MAILCWAAKNSLRGTGRDGFRCGTFFARRRPSDAKISSIMCRQKPNGSAWIILNFSYPSGNCVNDGIDCKLFPSSMSSTNRWLTALEKAGRGGLIMKVDWAVAYKHIHVRHEDLKLQYFSWLGMDLVELMLVFDARSSAGIYSTTGWLSWYSH